MQWAPESALNNILLCSLGWSLSLSGVFVQVSTTTLLANELVGSGLSTLPVGLLIANVSIWSLFYPSLVEKYGNLVMGIGCVIMGIIGSTFSLAVVASEYTKSNPQGAFGLICVGSIFLGFPTSLGSMLRFVSMRLASDKFRPTAVSISISGGILSAVIGPLLSNFTKTAMSIDYLGSYILVCVIYLVYLLIIISIRYPSSENKLTPAPTSTVAPARGIRQILKDDTRVALNIFYQVTIYSSMVGLMTAVPIAMRIAGRSFEESSIAVILHIVGMFLPSLFGMMAKLIKFFGQRLMIFGGSLVLLLGNLLFFGGEDTSEFFISGITVVGVGWSMSFVSANARYGHLLKSAKEREVVSGYMEFLLWGLSCVCAASAGSVMSTIGWFNFVGIYVGFIMSIVLVSLFELCRFGDQVKDRTLESEHTKAEATTEKTELADV